MVVTRSSCIAMPRLSLSKCYDGARFAYRLHRWPHRRHFGKRRNATVITNTPCSAFWERSSNLGCGRLLPKRRSALTNITFISTLWAVTPARAMCTEICDYCAVKYPTARWQAPIQYPLCRACRSQIIPAAPRPHRIPPRIIQAPQPKRGGHAIIHLCLC